MFVGDEVMLDIGFGQARAGLARLARSSLLLSPSEDAYEYGTIGAARVGAAGVASVGAAGLSRLVQVQARELADTGRCARWAIRWEAAGTGGMLFPVLDADLSLGPVGNRCTVLALTGSYRPPFGPLGAAMDRAVLHRVAAATIRNFLAQMAARITGQPGPESHPSRTAPAGRGSEGDDGPLLSL